MIWENTTLRFQILSGFTHSAQVTIQKSSIKSWTNSEVFLSSDARQSMWSASTYAVLFIGHRVLHIIANKGFKWFSSGPLSSQSWKRSGFASLQNYHWICWGPGRPCTSGKTAYWRFIVVFKGPAMLMRIGYVLLDLICMLPSSLDQMQKSDQKPGKAKRAFHLGGCLTLLLFLRRMGGIQITI